MRQHSCMGKRGLCGTRLTSAAPQPRPHGGQRAGQVHRAWARSTKHLTAIGTRGVCAVGLAEPSCHGFNPALWGGKDTGP